MRDPRPRFRTLAGARLRHGRDEFLILAHRPGNLAHLMSRPTPAHPVQPCAPGCASRGCDYLTIRLLLPTVTLGLPAVSLAYTRNLYVPAFQVRVTVSLVAGGEIQSHLEALAARRWYGQRLQTKDLSL